VPALGAKTRSPLSRLLPLTVGAMALVFLFGIGVVHAPEVDARNWSHQIAASRSGQIYYESAMRAADREVRSLKRARKKAARKLKKAKRNLGSAKTHKAAVKARFTTTLEQLDVAKDRLVSQTEAARPFSAPRGVSLAFGLFSTDPRIAPQVGSGGQAQHIGPPVVDAAESTSAQELAAEELSELEKRAKTQKQAFRKAAKKVRRVQRSKRVKTRTLAAVKRMKRGAISRREGAEAGLASRIMSMSRLAQRRVSKKTKVRPGSNSGFVWPTRGRLAQTYGCTGFRLNPPRGSCGHFHDGLDIAGYRGTPIRAAAVGVVSYIGWNPWDSKPRAFMIVVAHPGGLETLYGHVLPSRRVRVGQLVRKGQIIGYMGSTGHATGTHLHLELRRGRSILNPLAFL